MKEWQSGHVVVYKETRIIDTLDLLPVPGEHIQNLPLPLDDTLIADPRRHLAELAEKEKVKIIIDLLFVWLSLIKLY